MYRASNQPPETVFQPGGELKNSTQFYGDKSVRQQHPTFDLRSHWTGADSHYSSTTASAESAKEFADEFNRAYVYVIDPQPHGRYLNGLNYEDPTPATQQGLRAKMAAAVENGKAKLFGREVPATPYMFHENLMKQNEISVPGSIPTESVRGVLPFDRENKRLDYQNYSRNPEYKTLQQHRDDFTRAQHKVDTASREERELDQGRGLHSQNLTKDTPVNRQYDPRDRSLERSSSRGR